MRAVALWVTLLWGGIATASPEADKLFDEGRQLLANGKPAQACVKFEAALGLDPDAPGAMLNLGLCNADLQRYATALRWFRRAQTYSSVAGTQSHEDIAKQMTAKLAQLVPTVAIELGGHVPPGTLVTVDGATIGRADLGRLELDPGPHVIVVRAGEGYRRVELTLAMSEHRRLDLVLGTPNGPLLPRSSVPIYVGSAGAALGLAGLAWQFLAVAPVSDRLARATSQAAYEADVGAFESRRRIAYGLYGAAAVTVAAALVLRFTVYRDQRPAPVVIDAKVGPGVAFVEAAWRL